MRFNLWQPREPPPFDEAVWKRKNHETWEERWQQLDPESRRVFLTQIKAPARTGNRTPVSVAAKGLPPAALQRLVDAGFVHVEEGAKSRRVLVTDAALDFTRRLRAANRYHLLDPDQPSELEKYAGYCFFGYGLEAALWDVFEAVGVRSLPRSNDVFTFYVSRYRWPGWVTRILQDPLADRIIELVRDGPVLLADLPARLRETSLTSVRLAVSNLIKRLALFEGLRPDTLELEVGLLPSVREGLVQAARPRERPALQVCPAPREVAPEGGVEVNDLRAFLLEVAGEPPRLRKDQRLFQSETERFLGALGSVPAWLLDALALTAEKRLEYARRWTESLQLTRRSVENGQDRLVLSDHGQRWLAGRLEEQYTLVYDRLREVPRDEEVYTSYNAVDYLFLGSPVAVVENKKKHIDFEEDFWELRPKDRQGLREAVYQAFAALPVGVFHLLDSFLEHAASGEHNPLLRGLRPDQVTIFWESQIVPALEEEVEAAGQTCLDAILRQRLIPLGCVQPAVDEAGELCIARLPRLDRYFGHAPAATEAVEETPAAAPRVIVQPDFSVVIIGLNPAPAAELAPFCERQKGRAGEGALVLKITREAVLKAVSHGLAAAEILARLRRHASNEVPANVLREVQEWGDWVRQVSCTTLTVLRCPDRASADRVASALGKQAERLSDTVVALAGDGLATAERKKLQSQGIIVQGGEKSKPATRARKKKRRRYY
jgi:hypothetical protein